MYLEQIGSVFFTVWTASFRSVPFFTRLLISNMHSNSVFCCTLLLAAFRAELTKLGRAGKAVSTSAFIIVHSQPFLTNDANVELLSRNSFSPEGVFAEASFALHHCVKCEHPTDKNLSDPWMGASKPCDWVTNFSLALNCWSLLGPPMATSKETLFGGSKDALIPHSSSFCPMLWTSYGLHMLFPRLWGCTMTSQGLQQAL